MSNTSWMEARVQADEVVNNTTVGSRLDSWRQQLARQVIDDNLGELEQECLTEFLRVLTNLRPYLVQCYDRKDFPRTNNEMERSIRGRKHAVSPHQRAQELEHLFVTLRELGRLCGLVGAGCGSSPTTGAASCSPGSCALARTPAGHQSRSE